MAPFANGNFLDLIFDRIFHTTLSPTEWDDKQSFPIEELRQKAYKAGVLSIYESLTVFL